jgi:chromate transport protein ChrA
MDFWVAFWTAILTGLAIWILKKIGKRKLSKRLSQVATILGVVPILVIFTLGMYRMVNANDQTTIDAIGIQTAAGLGDWLLTNLVSIIAGYIGGFILVKVLPK